VHQEGDTVHLNAWIVMPGGGFDKDSPYRVKVNSNQALLPPEVVGKPVATPAGPNGSPIGFRIRVQVKEGTDPTNRASQPSETTTYPVYDPASVFHQPVINGYWGLTTAGRAYAVLRAEDGDGEVDRRIDHRPGDAVGIVDRVENGGATIEDQALRSKILTFFVDRAPTLRRSDPNFRPRQGEVFTAITGGRTLTLNMPADDVDQLDPNAGNNRVGGTPPYPPITRRKIAILGKLAGNPAKDTCYVSPVDFSCANCVVVTIPDYIATGNFTMRIRLCDCAQCDDLRWPSQCPFSSPEASPGQGRCVDTDIPCRLTVPEPAAIIGSNGTTQRPGSPTDSGRRQQ
jgi:hypothetical protein